MRSADRSEERIHLIEQYLKATKQLRDYNDESQDPNYTKVRLIIRQSKHARQSYIICSIYCPKMDMLQVITLDLSTIVTSVSGPKRPHDRVSVSEMHTDFQQCLTNKVSGPFRCGSKIIQTRAMSDKHCPVLGALALYQNWIMFT